MAYYSSQISKITDLVSFSVSATGFRTLSAGLLLPLAGVAWAIDLQPWNAIAPRPGLTSVQVAYVRNEYAGQYRQGTRQPGDPRVSLTTTQLRLVRTFEVSGQPALAFIQLPYGQAESHGSLPRLQDSGTGDLALAFALWPHADRERGRYLGMAAYFFLPTGSYVPRQGSLNAGKNRHREALQIGYHQQLSETLGGFIAIDQVRYGSNPEFGGPDRRLTQQALTSLQANLQYRLTPHWMIAGSWIHSLGGESALNGVSRDDRAQVDRYLLSLVGNFPAGRIAVQYGADLQTENSLKESRRFALRFSRVF